MPSKAKNRTRKSKPYNGPKNVATPSVDSGLKPNHASRAVSLQGFTDSITGYVFKLKAK